MFKVSAVGGLLASFDSHVIRIFGPPTPSLGLTVFWKPLCLIGLGVEIDAKYIRSLVIYVLLRCCPNSKTYSC